MGPLRSDRRRCLAYEQFVVPRRRFNSAFGLFVPGRAPPPIPGPPECWLVLEIDPLKSKRDLGAASISRGFALISPVGFCDQTFQDERCAP
jgi:hypothetical protein